MHQIPWSPERPLPPPVSLASPGVPAPAALPVVDPGVAGIAEEEKRVPDGPTLVPVAPDNATVG